MKKLLLQSICLILTLAWAGCTEDEETVKNLVLAEGTQTTQTVYADQTSGTGGGISFTAATDWTATVTDVTSKAESNTVSWLTLSQYSGGPGEYTLTLTLSTNLTGQTRKAQIEIRCGNDVITITVEQKAEDSEGNVPDAPIESMTYPAKVSKISYRENYWSEYEWGSPVDVDYEFKYDAEGRIAEYIYTAKATYEDKTTISFDYDIVGEIRVTETTNDSEPLHYALKLGSNGYVSSMETERTDYNDAMTYTFSYDETGHLSEIAWRTSYGSDYKLTYTYKNGTAEYTYLWYDNNTSGSMEENGLEYGTTPNNALNIDPNILFEGMTDFDASDGPDYDEYTNRPGRLDHLALLRLIGKRSDYYVSRDEDDVLSAMDEMPNNKEPNKTYNREFDSYEASMSDLSYNFEDNNRIKEISQTESVTKRVYTYQIIVGNELINPESPEEGYKWKRTENVLKEGPTNGTNTYTYTFTYYMN